MRFQLSVAQEEEVRIAREGVHAVGDEDVIEIMLRDVVRDAEPVVPEVDDVDFTEILQQEGDEAVRVGVADYQQGGPSFPVTISCRGQLPPMNMEYLSFTASLLSS